MASAFKLNDEIDFTVMAPDGKISGTGKVIGVFPAGTSNWLHVMQPGGQVRMVFEAKAEIRVRELEAA